MSFTPGPWQADSKELIIRRGQGSRTGFAREAREDCYIVETADGGHRHVAFVRSKMDARLVAAAPEMYDLLKKLRVRLVAREIHSTFLPQIPSLTDGMAEEINALLRRINGEEPTDD